jgi:hypothetical protein
MNDKHILIYLAAITVFALLGAGYSSYIELSQKSSNYEACLTKTQNAVECGKILK